MILKPDQQRTALLKEYIESRLGCADKTESANCRSFLKAYSKATRDGNPAGIELAIRETGRFSEVAIFSIIPGIGAVKWLPVLLTKKSDRLVHVIRETGDRMFPIERERKPFDPWDEVKPGRRVPPKVETVLVAGRKS